MNPHFFAIVFLLLLAGCSGGISGTGDGGPVLPVNETGQTAGNTDSQSPVAEADSLTSGFAPFPNQLLLNLPNTMLADTTASPSGSNTFNSPGTKLREAMAASHLDTIEIQIDLFLLDQHLKTNNLTSASGDNTMCKLQSNCELADQQFTITVDADAQAYAAGLLAPYSATVFNTSTIDTRSSFQAGDTITYSGVSLQSTLAGFFDNRLQYSRANGNRITLQWSSDQEWVSVLAQNTGSTLYSFLQADFNEMTLRRTDHARGNTSVQLVAMQNSETELTYVEADLHDDESFFVRAVGNTNRGAFFGESLLSDGTQYREATDSQGRLTDVETCNQPCTQWQPLLASQTLPLTFFDTNREIIDSMSNAIVNPVDVSVQTDGVNEFVITTGNATDTTTSPTTQPDTLACGGQRVGNLVRTFCWQPTPLGAPAFIYEENRINRALTYRLITRNDNL